MPVMMRVRATLVCVLLLSTLSFAQNWKQVHKQDELKWAKQTGLDPSIIHKLWRAASRAADENADDSRIANIDLDGLAGRHDVLFVTYAGENNCLTLTVFRQLSEINFQKVWSVAQPPGSPSRAGVARDGVEPPDASGFCDISNAGAKAYAENDMVLVRAPHSTSNGGVGYKLYSYGWNGFTYRLADEKELQDR